MMAEKRKGDSLSMEQDYKHSIALMRYSAIAPLIPGLPGARILENVTMNFRHT
jgi:hypothetical protein